MASVTSAYYVPYDPKKMPDPAASFMGHLETVDLNNQQSAILFRGNAGIGKSKVFALSAIKRDVNQDYQESFQWCLGTIVGLLESLSEDSALRQLLWTFVRDAGVNHLSIT
jgi:hypothetical protein